MPDQKTIDSPENDSIYDEHAKSIMALSAAWLGKTCPVDPSYQTTQAKSQSLFCTQRQSALPSLKIEQEKSINSLPPVDLLLPEHNIVVEVHGPFHYPGHDFKNTNGSTLLKSALLCCNGQDMTSLKSRRTNFQTLIQSRHILRKYDKRPPGFQWTIVFY